MNRTALYPPRATGPAASVLIVDDVPENLTVLGGILRQSGYRVQAANSGASALYLAARQPPPELILLDVMMPDMDGFEVLSRLRANPATRNIPVIFVTALDDALDEERGLSLGAADYIVKPIKPVVVLARVRTQLEAKQARTWLQDENSALEAEVARRMADNELIQGASIRALAHLAETRDPETGNHILRTQGYVNLLARRLQAHPRFAATLTPHYITVLTRSAPLHDIGKVGIPDNILQHPGKLDAAQWEVMKTHAALGAKAIEQAERDMERPVEFLGVAKEIAHWHHERWDGGGYPDGLSAEAIPVSARLMSLADVFDALISKRVYKSAFSYADARDIIREGRHSQFDPDVTDAFLDCFDAFVALANQLRDDES